MIEASGSEHLGQRQNGRPMEGCDPAPLFRDNQGVLPDGVLGCNSCWTTVRMAAQRLDAAEREHQAARRVAPVGAKSHDSDHVEAGDDFTARAKPYMVADVESDERIVNEHQPFPAAFRRDRGIRAAPPPCRLRRHRQR